MLNENVEDVKVVGLNVLVIHKDCDFLGWLKTNANIHRHQTRRGARGEARREEADKPTG
jgi:hypothetical protein